MHYLEIQGLFKDFCHNSRTFQGFMQIQGFFKTSSQTQRAFQYCMNPVNCSLNSQPLFGSFPRSLPWKQAMGTSRKAAESSGYENCWYYSPLKGSAPEAKGTIRVKSFSPSSFSSDVAGISSSQSFMEIMSWLSKMQRRLQ